jgi:hypothetical protein
MKKRIDRVREIATMRPEYVFRGGVRGKYAKRFAQGTNVVLRDTPPRPPRAARKRS